MRNEYLKQELETASQSLKSYGDAFIRHLDDGSIEVLHPMRVAIPKEREEKVYRYFNPNKNDDIVEYTDDEITHFTTKDGSNFHKLFTYRDDETLKKDVHKYMQPKAFKIDGEKYELKNE